MHIQVGHIAQAGHLVEYPYMACPLLAHILAPPSYASHVVSLALLGPGMQICLRRQPTSTYHVDYDNKFPTIALNLSLKFPVPSSQPTEAWS